MWLLDLWCRFCDFGWFGFVWGVLVFNGDVVDDFVGGCLWFALICL